MIGWKPADFWPSSMYEFTSALVGEHKKHKTDDNKSGAEKLSMKNPMEILHSLRARPGHRIVNTNAVSTHPLAPWGEG